MTDEALAEARGAGGALLGFNEPDAPDQAAMTVERALDAWPRLMVTGLRLGSPAPAANAATPGGWLDGFMAGADARGYRVDFIAVHWYGADFRTGPAVEQLREYLRQVHDRYRRPIWLTEYALADFATAAARSGAPRGATEAEQAVFVRTSTAMLESLPYVERYAWFALTTAGTRYGSGRYEAGVPTRAGRVYRGVR